MNPNIWEWWERLRASFNRSARKFTSHTFTPRLKCRTRVFVVVAGGGFGGYR